MSAPDGNAPDESNLHAGDLTVDNPIEQRGNEHFDDAVGVDDDGDDGDVDAEHDPAPES